MRYESAGLRIALAPRIKLICDRVAGAVVADQAKKKVLAAAQSNPSHVSKSAKSEELEGPYMLTISAKFNGSVDYDITISSVTPDASGGSLVSTILHRMHGSIPFKPPQPEKLLSGMAQDIIREWLDRMTNAGRDEGTNNSL